MRTFSFLCLLFATIGWRSLAAQSAADAATEIDALIAGLSSSAAAEVEKADLALERLAFEAGKPGAERRRRALALALGARLGEEIPHQARILIARRLELLGKAEVVPALAGVLSKDGNPELREAARRALEANPSPNAKRALREALPSSRGALRAAICRSLGTRRDLLAVAELMGEARSPEPEVRLAAVEALALIGDINSLPAVEGALERASGIELLALRRAYLRLADALADNDERGTARRIYVRAMEMGPSLRAAALIGAARAGLQSEVPKIAAALDEADSEVRGAARQAAAMMPGAGMSEAVAAKLALAKGEARAELVAVLSERRADPAAAAALLRSARNDEDGTARVIALEALESAAAPDEALPVLIEALEAGGEAAATAGRVLARLEGTAAGEALVAGAREARTPGVRAALLRIIGLRRDPRGLPVLEAALEDAGANARREACTALGRIGGAQAFSLLLGFLSRAPEAERDAAADALARLEMEGKTEALVEAYRGAGGAPPAARAALLRALRGRSEPAVSKLLLEEGAKADLAGEVRLAVVEGLAAFEDPAVLPLLLEAAEKGSGELQAAGVRGSLRFAERLARDDRAAAQRLYSKALEMAQGDEEARIALRGLAEVGEPEVLEQLEPFFRRPALAREAGRAAARIGERLGDGRRTEAVVLYLRLLELDVDDATATQCVRRLARLGVEVDIARKSGFISRWWIAGPFSSPDGALWEKGLSPERLVELERGVEHEGRRVEWKAYRTPDARGRVDLDQVIGNHSSAAAYLYAEVESEGERQVLLKIGSDDAVACWLNGKMIHQNKVDRGLAPDQDVVEGSLRAGKNAILLKVLNNSGPWGACLRITDRDGKPLELAEGR